MQVRAMNTSNELNAVKAQESSLQRKIRLSEATEAELKDSTTGSNTNKNSEEPARVWAGIGKMFLITTVQDQLEELRAERTAYADQLSALGKKKVYLETTLTNVMAAMKELNIKM